MAGEDDTTQDSFSPDDVAGWGAPAPAQQAQSFQPDESWGQPTAFHPDESWGAPQPAGDQDLDSSALGSATRAFVKGAAPAIAGAGGGGAGAIVGGAELGATIGEGPGALVGGLAGAAAGGYLGAGAEDWILDKLGLREGTGFFSREQEQADTAKHPYAQFGGDLLSNLLAFGTGGPGEKISKLQRGLGAVIMGGQEAAQELYNEGKIDPAKVLASAGVGAFAPVMRGYIEKPSSRVGQSVADYLGAKTGRVATPRTAEAGQPGRPDLNADEDDLSQYATSDKQDIKVANDITTAAPGVAEENNKVPNVPNIGMGDNAPMLKTEASGPNTPERDLRKDATPASKAGIETQPSSPGVTKEAIPQDVAAALGGGNEQAPAVAPDAAVRPSGPDVAPPPETGAAPQPDNAPVAAPVPESVPGEGAGDGQPPAAGVPAAEPAAQVPVEDTNQRLAPVKLGAMNLQVPLHVAAALQDPKLQNAILKGAVNRGGHVPYIAGASKSMDVTHIDSNVPRMAVLKDGTKFSTTEPMIMHEQIEKHIMEQLTAGGMSDESAYKVAHVAFAEPLENAYYRSLGIDPKLANDWWRNQQEVINRAPKRGIPADLYEKPYPHNRAADVHEGDFETHSPSREELLKAHEILSRPQEPAPNMTPAGGTPTQEELHGPVTAPVTSRLLPRAEKVAKPPDLVERVPKVLRVARETLKEKGWTEMLSRLDKLPLDRQAIVAHQILTELNSRSDKTKVQGDITRVPQKRPQLESGVTARSPKDAQRKQGALDQMQNAVATFGSVDDTLRIPTAKDDTSALMDRANRLVQMATNGQDPAKVYKPNTKTPSWLITKAAYEMLRDPTPANIHDFMTTEHLLQNAQSEEERLDIAKEIQAKNRTDADVKLQPAAAKDTNEIPDRPEEDQSLERHTFAPFENKFKEESDVFAKQQNDLRDWLNGLSDEDYTRLAEAHDGELKLEVDASDDPGKLLESYKDEVEDLQRYEPKVKNANEPQRVTKRTSAKDMIDRQSPEFKARMEEAKEKLKAEEQSTFGKLKDKAREMMKDTNGSGKLFPYMDWMLKKGRNMFNDPDPITTKYIESLGKDFHAFTNGYQRVAMRLWHNLKDAIGDNLTTGEWRQIYRAIEDKATAQLPQKLKDTYDKRIKPLIDEYNRVYDHVRKLAPDLELPLRLPTDTGFVPRLRINDTPINPNTDVFGKGRTLTDWSGPLREREFYALTNGKDRVIFQPKDDGITIHRTGTRTDFPYTGETGIGDIIRLDVGNGFEDFHVDHAKAREVMANVKDSDGQFLKFHENPLITLSNAVRGVSGVRSNMIMLDKIKHDSRFLRASSTVEKPGYIQTKLPQLKRRDGQKLYMDPRIAELLDDFVKPGFDERSLNTLSNVSTKLIKTLYMFSPFVHAFNEFDLFVRGRGLDWINPEAYRRFTEFGRQAIDSVNHQDQLQDRILAAGGSPMYGNILASHLMDQFMELAGKQMSAQPWKYDPFAKLFGFNTKAFGDSMANKSNRIMWWLSDVMLTHRVLENMGLHGMSMTDAVADAHKFISDYRIAPRVMGSRLFSKVLQEPALALFSRYHYGLWKSMAGSIKELADVKQNPQQAMKAAGNLIAGLGMTFVVYPLLLDAAARTVTQNPNASFARRGLSALTDTISGVATGNKDPSALMPDVITPSLPVSTAMHALTNTDWKREGIMPRQNYLNPINSLRALGRGGEYLAENLVPPYGTFAGGARTGSVFGGLKKFGEGVVGIKEATPQGAAYEKNIGKYNKMDETKRLKHPGGPFEKLINSLTGS